MPAVGLLTSTLSHTLGRRLCGRPERDVSRVGLESYLGVLRVALRTPVSCRARLSAGEWGEGDSEPDLTQNLAVVEEEVQATTNAIKAASSERQQVVQRMSTIKRKLRQPGLSASVVADLRDDLEDAKGDKASIDDDKKWYSKSLTLLYEKLAQLKAAQQDLALPQTKVCSYFW